MKLTARQREILTGLRDRKGDLVESKGEWWHGNTRTSARAGFFLLRAMLIRPISSEAWDKRYIGYEITEKGRRVLDDPDFDPMVQVLRAFRR